VFQLFFFGTDFQLYSWLKRAAISCAVFSRTSDEIITLQPLARELCGQSLRCKLQPENAEGTHVALAVKLEVSCRRSPMPATLRQASLIKSA
jgi:hypothetical protein